MFPGVAKTAGINKEFKETHLTFTHGWDSSNLSNILLIRIEEEFFIDLKAKMIIYSANYSGHWLYDHSLRAI